MMNLNDKAWEYAEKYGIVDFELKDDTMVYERTYYQEGYHYICTVDLNTMQETREGKKIKGGRK